MKGMAELDREKGNFLERITALEKLMDSIHRWAAPIGERPLPNPPGIQAWRTTAQSIQDVTVSGPVVVTSLTDQLDEDGLELESGNIIKLRRDSATEWYHFWAHAEWAANSTGYRAIEFQVRNINTGAWVGLTPDNKNALPSPDKTHHEISMVYQMGATDDAVRFAVGQNTGGNLNLNLFLVQALMIKSGDEVAG